MEDKERRVGRGLRVRMEIGGRHGSRKKRKKKEKGDFIGYGED